jgi:thioredoxin-like negative regulator of GroEL
MAKRGGTRPGAGRPVSTATLEAQLQRELLVKALEPHIEAITKALVKKAKAGDVQAAKELFDRAWGKAPQNLDLTSKGRPLLIDTADE